jgi:hypothetical protein
MSQQGSRISSSQSISFLYQWIRWFENTINYLIEATIVFSNQRSRAIHSRYLFTIAYDVITCGSIDIGASQYM